MMSRLMLNLHETADSGIFSEQSTGMVIENGSEGVFTSQITTTFTDTRRTQNEDDAVVVIGHV